MPFFDTDYNVLSWQTLPVRLRQSVMYAYAKVCMTAVIYLAGIFKSNRLYNLYMLAHNSQVCFMQGALNDVFDNVLRRITIGDPVYDDPLYVYEADELKPVWVGLVSEEGSTTYPNPEWVYLLSECYSGGGAQFIVHVPVGLVYDANRMKALINFYRVPSKNVYIIVSP